MTTFSSVLSHAWTICQRIWSILTVVITFKTVGVALCLFAIWRVHLDMYARCGLDNGGSWSVGIATGSSPTTLRINPFPSLDCSTVADELVSFIADPFLLNFPQRSPNWYMFFEAKNSRTTWHGDIGMAASTDNGASWVYHQIIIDEQFHLSYPFVIQDYGWDGISTEGVYIAPESYQANSIRLYKPIAWPSKWMYVKDLMSGKPFIDSSFVFYSNKWWIFTMVDNELLLYYGVYNGGRASGRAQPFQSDEIAQKSILNMEWILHPSSPIRDSSCTYRRPGGRPVIGDDGVLYVFAQDDSKTYGGAVRVLKVTALTVSTYREEFVSSLHPEAVLESDEELAQQRINKGNVAFGGGHDESNFNNQKAHPNALPFHWISKRLHHVDAHKIGPDHWIASVDGDSQLNKTPLIRVILLCVLVLSIYLVIKFDLILKLKSHFPALQHQTNNIVVVQQKELARLVKSHERALWWIYRVGLVALAAVTVYILVRNRWDTKPIVGVSEGLSSLIVPSSATANIPESHIDFAPSKGVVQNIYGSEDFKLEECPLTMVTGLYDVGRGEFQGETRGWKDYLNYFKQILDLNTCMIIHVDFATVEFVKQHREYALPRTVLIAENWADIVNSYPYKKEMQAILDDKEFLSKVKRPGRPEMKLVGYNIVMFKKVDWVRDATLSNPFHSKYFFWFDAGYGHGKMMGFLKGQVWPDPKKVNAIMNDQQIYILRVRDFVRDECAVEKEMFTRHVKTVAGGFFGGAIGPIQSLYFAFHKANQRSLKGGYMDDDQAVFFGAWCDHPSLFVFEDCPRNLICVLLDIKPCWDSWNCPVKYFAPDE